MDKPVLNEKNQFPDDTIIFSHINSRKDTWQSLFSAIDKSYPSFDKQWRYYNDGKSWLLKVTRKSKTILWVSVFTGYFKTAFYFGGKAERQEIDYRSQELGKKLLWASKRGMAISKIEYIMHVHFKAGLYSPLSAEKQGYNCLFLGL